MRYLCPSVIGLIHTRDPEFGNTVLPDALAPTVQGKSRQAMGSHLYGFGKKNDGVITAPQCISLAFVSMVLKIDVAWLALRASHATSIVDIVSVVLKIEPTLYIFYCLYWQMNCLCKLARIIVRTCGIRVLLTITRITGVILIVSNMGVE